MPKVLVIDDEPKIAAFVRRALTAHGLTVDSEQDSASGLERVLHGDYDLVVLDLLMPGMGGLGVLRATMDARPGQRVLVLSAISDVDSKVRCLELGAADYLAKPFALRELVARVWARLRQPGVSGADGVLRAGRVTLDQSRRTVDAGAGPVPLSGREYDLLRHLVRRAGVVCPRDELLRDVWGCEHDPGTNVVDVYVRRLRAKIGQETIETIRNVGYWIPVASELG